MKLSALFTFVREERLALSVMVCAAVAMTVHEYYFLPGAFVTYFPEHAQSLAPGVSEDGWQAGMQAPWWGVLAPWAWWVAGLTLLWVLLPIGVARMHGLRPLELGLSVRGLLSKLWVYGLMFAAVVPAVLWASTRENFTQMYPMLKPWYCEQWTWVVLLGFWALYAAQFFAVEFFFRGWMLFTLEKRMGMAAIAVMLVPYCMIHYHKPMPEALASIVAGLALGWMALKTRSIWGGWLVHVAVAISMDTLSLLKGDWGLPARWT